MDHESVQRSTDSVQHATLRSPQPRWIRLAEDDREMRSLSPISPSIARHAA